MLLEAWSRAEAGVGAVRASLCVVPSGNFRGGGAPGERKEIEVRKFAAIAFAILVIGTLAAACGGGDKKTITVPGSNEKVTLSEKLPSDFPSDFPIYKGAKVQGSATGTQQGVTGTVVTWETGDSLDKVKAFYEDAFTNGAWTSTSSGTMGDGAYWSVENKSGTKDAWVSISQSGNKTDIVAVVGDKEAMSGGAAEATPTAKASAGKTPSTASKSPTPEEQPSAELPKEVTLDKEFPKDKVPLPSGARVTNSSSYASGGVKTFMAEVYVKGSPSEVADFFKGELPKHGWTSSLTSTEGTQHFLMFTGETENTSVAVSADEADVPGYTAAQVVVTISGE